MVDLDFVRPQFPAFSEPSLEGFAFFENAGGSYACGQAIEALRRYYAAMKVQPYYGFEPSRSAGEAMDRARRRLAAAGRAGPGADQPPRSAAAGRADQPPGHPGHRVARGPALALPGRGGAHHP